MGKRGGKKYGRGRGGGQLARADYTVIPRTNDLYEKYYNELKPFSDNEREDFWSALRRDLPNSFRFTGSKGHALSVQQRLKDHYIPQITSISYEGQAVAPLTPLPWYPDELAWQMTTPKNIVRKFPPFASFQKFLVSETSVGNISRQEVVSMIPPLVLDVRPGMTVLDLCAAPGSKSAQLIEMVHGGEEGRMREVARKLKQEEGREVSPDGEMIRHEVEDEKVQGDWNDDGRSTGLLIANDVDYRRSHMLIHQMKRLNSPNLIVMNHDATQFPSIKLPSDPVFEGQKPRGKYLKFDRILADVPCSGDGTVRKNQSIWKDWNPNNSLGLHIVQCRILVRALQMLKVGGRVVYSTCSMNPVENEAVVASAIHRCGGWRKAILVDCSDLLPELKRQPGMRTWKVMDRRGGMWESWNDVESHRDTNGADYLSKLSAGMFPPSEADEEIPLDRCMRVLAHQQDTGAFFVAVLEKKSEIRARPESEPKIPTAPSTGYTTDTVTASTAQEPSVISVIDEIEAKTLSPTEPTEHISAIDDMIPSEPLGHRIEDASAAARQNQENIESGPTTAEKHALDDAADAYATAKRVKLRNADAPAPLGEEDRQVHYPPPPAAELDLTRHESSNPVSSFQKPMKKHKQQFEEPFKYLGPSHNELQIIYNFYGLHPRFPRDRFMVRNASGDPAKTIYYTSALGRDILIENEGKGLKFVHCGVKMFVKQDVQQKDACKWRVQTDGLQLLEAWVSDERVVRLHSRATLRSLLIEMFPKVDGDGWKSLGEIGKQTKDITYGCCVLRIDKGEGEDAFSERMVLPLWRSLHSLNLMLPKEDRKAMLLRLYDDETPLMDHSKDRFKKAKDSEDEAAAEVNGRAKMEAEAEDLELDDEEDGGVRLPSGELELEAQMEADLATGVKDEEDVKKEVLANGRA